MMEHFYQTINSENWFGYEDLYKSMVDKFDTNSHFVEVGSWKGMSACYMAVEIINSGKKIKFDCVDTWKFVDSFVDIPSNAYENLFEIFLENISPVKNHINVVRKLSWEAASDYDDNSLDFVFIDAGHDYESVKKDLLAWIPKIKQDGVIAGHDYYHKPVATAVHEVIGFDNIIPGTCWIHKKTKI